jgi:hypothetical protein
MSYKKHSPKNNKKQEEVENMTEEFVNQGNTLIVNKQEN